MIREKEVRDYLIKNFLRLSGFDVFNEGMYTERLVDLGLDDLDYITLIMDAERDFEITIPDNLIIDHEPNLNLLHLETIILNIKNP